MPPTAREPRRVKLKVILCLLAKARDVYHIEDVQIWSNTLAADPVIAGSNLNLTTSPATRDMLIALKHVSLDVDLLSLTHIKSICSSLGTGLDCTTYRLW